MSARLGSQLLRQSVRGYATKAPVKVPLTLNGLAGKYASSAFVAAASKDAKSLEAVEGDLKKVQSALKGPDGAKLLDFLNNPVASAKARTSGIDKLLGGKENAITRNLFEVLGENGRLADTEKVIEGFLQLMGAHRGEVEVTVTSATPLDKSTAQRLEAALKQSSLAQGGKTLKVTQKVQPTIQGGLIVDFGDRSVDLSVASRVNKLNNLLSQGL